MKPQTRGASPGSRLGFAQLLGSRQPKPVGFNCYGCRTLCSGTQGGKLDFPTTTTPYSQQTNMRGIQCLQRAEGLDETCREFAGGILAELGLHRGQAHSWCNAVDVSAPCLVQHRILSCIFSGAHTAWHLVCAFVTAAVCWSGCFNNSPGPWKTHP